MAQDEYLTHRITKAQYDEILERAELDVIRVTDRLMEKTVDTLLRIQSSIRRFEYVPGDMIADQLQTLIDTMIATNQLTSRYKHRGD